MTNILNFPEQRRIEEEASVWLVRLDSGPLAPEESSELSAWLAANPQHHTEIIRLCKLWDEMDILSELSILFPRMPKGPDYADGKPVSALRRPAFVFTTLAASLLLGIVILLVSLNRFSEVPVSGYVPQQTSYQTAVGEQKEIQLADGTVVNLNTDSHLTVRFDNKFRYIWLDKGEIFFKVAHEPLRPFLVHAGGGLVRAVGTAFAVRMKGHDVEVTVTEGKVEVASTTPDMKKNKDFNDLSEIISKEFLTTLGAGQTAEFGDRTINSVRSVEPETVSRKLSWQHGMLEFKGETLEEVVNEISRYTDTKIIISDPEIRDIRIGGYFKTGEVNALLSVLQTGFPIEINRINENLIYLGENKTPPGTSN
jgi:transmembrane sensor